MPCANKSGSEKIIEELCGSVVSPIVENRDYFNKNVLPFYRNVDREGVRLGA